MVNTRATFVILLSAILLFARANAWMLHGRLEEGGRRYLGGKTEKPNKKIGNQVGPQSSNSNNGAKKGFGLGPEPKIKTGHATRFDSLGAPYGGCGVPQKFLDSQNFVALNVVATPKDYTGLERPLVQNISKKGAWDQGRNCGRWVKVTIGDDCKGAGNSGEQKKSFCAGGSYKSDKYNGATLNMIVGDSCGDGNAWCRDDPYHLDLATKSLKEFVKDSHVVQGMDTQWNNRKISWEYIKAPHYQGDIKIFFMNGTSEHWTSIGITNLPNGIHGVEFYQKRWNKATQNSDMGQAFLISPSTQNGKEYKIRVKDADNQLLFNGREYSFKNPCKGVCTDAFLQVQYNTN